MTTTIIGGEKKACRWPAGARMGSGRRLWCLRERRFLTSSRASLADLRNEAAVGFQSTR